MKGVLARSQPVGGTQRSWFGSQRHAGDPMCGACELKDLNNPDERIVDSSVSFRTLVYFSNFFML